MSLNGYSWVEGNTPNAVDPSGMTQIAYSENFNRTSTTCDRFYYRFPEDSPYYAWQQNYLKRECSQLVLNCVDWLDPSRDIPDSPHIVEDETQPLIPPPDSPECDIMNLNIKTEGYVRFGFSAYSVFGGGVSLLELWDVYSDRFMRLIVPEFGIGVGESVTGGRVPILDVLSYFNPGHYLISESTLDEFKGLGIQYQIVGIFMGVSVSSPNPGGECDITLTSGFQVGIQISLALTYGIVVYDSNW